MRLCGLAGTLLAAVYFRTGNIWVTVFIHAAMDITSMLIGGLYGTQTAVSYTHLGKFCTACGKPFGAGKGS